ncbi:hypothetical protein MMC19_004182 [Ptychographa xylographoides]|nr:hypothetical protein [Ptychographa xylographoides]
MATQEIQESAAPLYLSPKRKRDNSSDYVGSFSPSPIRLRTSFAPQSYDNQSTGSDSPRTCVAGQLQALDLQGESSALSSPPRPFSEQFTSNSNFDFSLSEQQTFSKATFRLSPPENYISLTDGAITPPHSQMPSAPKLKPVSPSPSRTISPLPQSRIKSPPPPRFSASPPPMLSLHTFTSAPNLPSTNLPTRTRPSSPPPPFYSPQEDSTIENLGINGIGFRPTPAQSYARAQRRKQQVAEWKSREAKEARQRRIELRRKRDGNLGLGAPRALLTTGEKEMEREEMTVRRVRFVEG